MNNDFGLRPNEIVCTTFDFEHLTVYYLEVGEEVIYSQFICDLAPNNMDELTCLSNMKAYFASVTVLKNQTLVL